MCPAHRTLASHLLNDRLVAPFQECFGVNGKFSYKGKPGYVSTYADFSPQAPTLRPYVTALPGRCARLAAFRTGAPAVRYLFGKCQHASCDSSRSGAAA